LSSYPHIPRFDSERGNLRRSQHVLFVPAHSRSASLPQSITQVTQRIVIVAENLSLKAMEKMVNGWGLDARAD